MSRIESLLLFVCKIYFVYLIVMSKATTIKEAIRRFEERTKQNGSEAKVVELQFQWPPIEKMDSALGSLTNCE